MKISTLGNYGLAALLGFGTAAQAFAQDASDKDRSFSCVKKQVDALKEGSGVDIQTEQRGLRLTVKMGEKQEVPIVWLGQLVVGTNPEKPSAALAGMVAEFVAACQPH